MNDQTLGAPHGLEERRDGFAYDYRMLCECGMTSTLTAAEYFAETDNAHMYCGHCGGQIHFGPAVAALRDEHDPALRDERVPTFAWYHTSTTPDWPTTDYSVRLESDLKWIERGYGLSRESYIAHQTAKALHVGTYEAAIENMLRRMRNQADGASQFYLYRVALRIGPGRINAGYRDENHATAADISVNELEAEGLDAVRYLNVHGAMGTLSLAVRPEAIEVVQRLQIPIPGLSLELEPDAGHAASDALVAATRALSEAEAEASLNTRTRRLMQFGIRPGPGGVAKRIGELEGDCHDSWRLLEGQLADALLPHVSPVVRRDFNSAVGSWHSENGDAVADFIARYRQLGSLLERADDVVARLAQEKWRVVGAV